MRKTSLFMALILMIFSTFVFAESAPTPLTIIAVGKPDMKASNDRVIAELEKRTNTKLTFITLPWDGYDDKIAVMGAAGQLPDIVVNVDPQNSLIARWIKQGMIIPFSDAMLKVAPEVTKEYASASYYSELKVNGKIYFQPIYWNTNVAPNYVIHYNKSVLDQLGVKEPKTLDELYNVAKLAKDKLGLLFGVGAKPSNPMNRMNFVMGANGLVYNGWTKDKAGNYVFANVQPGALAALKWVQKLAADGILDPSVYNNNGDADGPAELLYFTGKYSFFAGNGGGHIPRYQDRLLVNNPKAQEWVMPAPAGPSGQRGYAGVPSFWHATAITGNAKNPVAAAAFINYLLTPEGQLLTQFGIEGVHYTYKGEKKLENIVLNMEERAKDPAENWDGEGRKSHVLGFPYVSWVPQNVQDFFAMYGKDPKTATWYADMWKNQLMYSTKNEILLNTTPKWVAFTKTSDDLTDEYFNKIILSPAANTDALFKEYVEKWNKAGGVAASKEMSDAAKKLFK